MPQVRLGIVHPNATGALTEATGTLDWRPTRRRIIEGNVVLPTPFTAAVGDTITIAPTEPGWAWAVIERLSGSASTVRYLTIPDVADVLDYADLTEVAPGTLEPTAEPEAAWWAALEAAELGGGGGAGGVTDHGALTGLADDDHPQYLTNARGDARYYTQAQTDTALAGKQPAGSYATPGDVTTASTADRARANHTGTQAAGTITGLATVATSGAYTDLTGKPTIPAAYTDEQARDALAAALVAGTGVTITPDDAADTITITASGGGVVGSVYPVIQPAAGERMASQFGAGNGNAAVALGDMFATPLLISAALTVTTMWVVCDLAATGGLLRLGIYAAATSRKPAGLLLDAGTVDGSTTGVKSVAVTSTALQPGFYWLVAVPQGALAPRYRGFAGVGLAGYPISANSDLIAQTPGVNFWRVQGVTAALPSSPTWALNGNASPNNVPNVVLSVA